MEKGTDLRYKVRNPKKKEEKSFALYDEQRRILMLYLTN
jgi:hypothetical protein